MAEGSLKSTIRVSITNFLDSGCIVAGSVGMASWSTQFGLSTLQTGILGALSANAFGAALGAIIGGPLSDKFGRRFIYVYDMLIYMVGCLMCVFANNFGFLLAGFIITGIAVGAGVPASWSYIGETAAGTERAKNIGVSQFAWSLGPAVVFIAALIVAPLGLLGYRLIFVGLAIVAFVAWNLQRTLPESQDWLDQKAEEKKTGHKSKANSHPYRTLFSNKTSIKWLFFLIGVYALWNLVAGSQGMFLPYIFENVVKLDATQSSMLNILIWVLTACATYFGFAKFGDKVNHRFFFGVGATMSLLSWIILTLFGMSQTWALWTFAALWGISAGIGAQAWYALWATELFPTQFRAGSQGVMFFVVRAFAGAYTIFVPTIMANLGFSIGGYIMIAILIISLLVGITWTPKTRGKSLEEITKEQYGEDFLTQDQRDTLDKK
ncbi:MFS transporter [Loigolactobacillus zhaoyuanensis]|uniref:MFS transporter n=1 Tax=Loigolactobacillus zhaoyuanensis TaxID=2486017 RepID=UPI000F73AD09|nr:MFS transporter [Loigolactobacillus zhaoyuanensis]